MQTISIVVSALAMLVSLVVTLPVIFRKRAMGEELAQYSEHFKHLEMMLEQARRMDPAKFQARRAKMEKVERLMGELVSRRLRGPAQLPPQCRKIDFPFSVRRPHSARS